MQLVYRDASRSFWVEIGEDDLFVKRSVTVPGFPESSVVWVRRGALLTVGALDPEEEDVPRQETPENLLTEGDPPPWADVTRVKVEAREG